MARIPLKVTLLEENQNSPSIPKTKYPLKHEAVYVNPMKGPYKGQGRKCSNCFMWISEQQKCVIHDPGEAGSITGNHICNYHVPGNPFANDVEVPAMNVQVIPSNLSGLEFGPKEGTKCGNCRFFNPDKNNRDEYGVLGKCRVIVEPIIKEGEKTKFKKATVHEFGCCSRWEEYKK